MLLNNQLAVGFAEKSSQLTDDGRYITVTNNNGYLQRSTNWGTTWANTDSSRNWVDVKMSSTGQYQTAVCQTGYIYRSTDYGATFGQVGTSQAWGCVAVSGTGQYQIAGVYGGYLYQSTDYGANWGQVGTSHYYYAADICADGSKAVAVTYGEYVYLSSDYGANWNQKDPAGATRSWISCSISGDGNTIVLCPLGSASAKVYATFDFGSNWSVRINIAADWTGVSISGNGKYSVVNRTTGAGSMYRSTDGAQNYTQQAPGTGQITGTAFNHSGNIGIWFDGYTIRKSINYGATYSTVSSPNSGSGYIGIAINRLP